MVGAVLVSLVGLVGTVVPVLPGSLLVWAATLGSLIWLRDGGLVWSVGASLTGLLVLATIATFVLPARRGLQGDVARSSLALALVGAIVGGVVIPVVGFPVGLVAALYLAEHRRHGDGVRARRDVGQVLRAYGLGVLVELGVSLVMLLIWAVTLLAT